jgi:mannose-6-phosphate isomerase-like protein (cupin superfamily)
MKKMLFAAVLLATTSLVPAFAQLVQPAIVVSAADVEKLSATANTAQTAATPPRANVLEKIITLDPYVLNLEHRIGPQTAAIHQSDVELMIVLSGSATFTTGGTLVGGGAPRGGNITGTDVTGGKTQHVVQGDLMLVPEGTPHTIQPEGGVPLVLATLHMPRNGDPVPAPGRAAATPKLYVSAADYPAMIARAKAALPDALKAGRWFSGETLLSLAPYRVGLEYRSAKGTPSVHKTDAEMMYVLDGEGTIVTDGHLVNGHDTNPANAEGDAIEGGVTHHMAKGDFIFVPEGTPHQAYTSGTFVLATLHVPRPVPAAPAAK